jgi:phosphonate transport system substrate-binding protein
MSKLDTNKQGRYATPHALSARFALSVLLTLVLSTVVTHAASEHNKSAPPQTYHLGIFPYMAPRQTVKFYGPIAADMEQALHHPVKLESQRSFTDFTRAMALHSYDIALIQPFDYPEVVEHYGYIPLAQLSVPLVTQFYVRDDSHYHKLEDLRGTTIAMPPAKAANSRMALRALYDNKLIPGRDLNIRYFNSHDSCLQQVWVGNASACSSAPPPVRVFQKHMQARFRVIFKTQPIPHVVFVVNPRVPQRDRKILQQLILNWSHNAHGRKLLKNLGFPPFAAIKPDEYAIMHHYEPAQTATGTTRGNAQDIVLGIFPYLTSRQLVKTYAPLLPALTQAVQKPVHLRTATDFGSYGDNLAAGKYDIVLVQPFDYEKALHYGYLPLAMMDKYAFGSFYVRKDSHYKKVIDLKGQLIAMAPPESAMAHLGRLTLKKYGLTPNHDVRIKYLKTHDSCLREVQRGTAAACVTSPIILQTLPKNFSNIFRQVGKTEKMPGVAFLAHKRLSAAIRDKIKAEIISWKNTVKGRTILKSMQFGNFVPVRPDDYQKLSTTATGS